MGNTRIDLNGLAQRIYDTAVDQEILFCTNEDGSDTYGAIKKGMFDTTSLIINYLGGSCPFITDLMMDSPAEVADALRHYFHYHGIESFYLKPTGCTRRYGVFFTRHGYAEIEAESVEDAMRKADETITSDKVSWDDDWPCTDAMPLDEI